MGALKFLLYKPPFRPSGGMGGKTFQGFRGKTEQKDF